MSIANNGFRAAVLTGLALGMIACAKPVPGLHERERFSGTVEIRWLGPDGTEAGTASGELAFDRRRKNFQWTVRTPEPTRAVTWLPGGGHNVFVDGVPTKAPQPKLIETFERLQQVVGFEQAESAQAQAAGPGWTYRSVGADPAWTAAVEFAEIEPPHGSR